MNTPSFLGVGLPTLVCLSLASITYAGPITVTNASFETLGGGGLPFLCGTACSYSTDGVIPGWTVVGSGGLFRPGSPTNTSFFNTVTDGTTTAYSDSGSISQTVVPTVVLGDIYTLMVDIGNRKDLNSPLGTAALVINGVTYLAVGAPATRGNWSTYTATYTGLAADVGKSITIRLATAGVEGNWDNVRLSDSLTTGTTPEPASGALVGLALLACAGIAGRKRRVKGSEA